MKRKLKVGSTSQVVPIRVDDTGSTTGAGLTGLTYSSSGLVARYKRSDQTAWQTLTLTAPLGIGQWVSGGLQELGRGIYELSLPNAVLQSGTWVIVQLYGATNMADVNLEIELDAVNYQDATSFGLTRLDTEISSRSSHTSGDSATATAVLLRTEHGSGAWTTAPILGPYTLTAIILSEASSGALVGARVSLKDGADSLTLDQKSTDASGRVAMSIDAGSYRLHVGQLAGYESLAAQSLEVSGNRTATFYLTPLQPGSPANPGLCTVYGYVLVGNTPVTGAAVTAKLVSKGAIADNVLLSIQTLTDTTDTNGYFELGLIRSDQVTRGEAEYKIVIPESGINQTVTIPNQSAANLTSLLAPQL